MEKIMTEKKFLEEMDERGYYYYRSGDNIMLCCPFHGENNPSLGVNFKKRKFNCLACGEHGNIELLIRALFLEDIVLESELELDYDEDYSGIKHILDRIQVVSYQGTIKEEKIRILVNFDSGYYQTAHGKYKDYLRSRKINQRTEVLFDIKCGIWKGDERILVPEYDEYRRLIAVMGRSINTNDGRNKIRKTKHSDVGKILFGLDKLMRPRENIVYFHSVVLVEGEFDVMYLQQNGVPAISIGTKFPTEYQLYKLSKYFERVYLNLDGDSSVEDWNKCSRMIREYCQVDNIRLPDKQDPNDLSVEEVNVIYRGIILKWLIAS